MNKTKIIIAIVLAVVITVVGILVFKPNSYNQDTSSSGFVQEPPDEDKTILSVYSYAGGYGNQWLIDIKERFEEKYADYEGANGKKGVQLQLYIEDKTLGTEMLKKTNSLKDVIFTESVFYYDWVLNGNNSKMLDITSAVTNPLSDLNEDKSIFDKMTKEQQEFFNAGTDQDKKIFAVPYRTDIEGIIYNVDLFNQSSLYYAKGGCPSEFSAFTQATNANKVNGSFTTYKWTNLAGERSAGPDGLYGTDDDGLPATYDEFFNLCDYMAYEHSIVPFTWGGKKDVRANYLSWLYQQLLADYEGLDGYTSYFTFDGTSSNIIKSIDQSGNIVWEDEVNISEDGSVISRSAGRYYVTKFFERLIKNADYYDALSFNESQSHMAAQMDYLDSKYAVSNIAFLVDGIWWENEANEYFLEMEEDATEDGRLNRNFGLLPFPKATMDKIGEKTTFVDTHASLCFVNGNISSEKIDIAEKLVRFCFTDISNKKFNLLTGCPRAMGGYELTSDDRALLSAFGENAYKIVTTAPIVAPYGKNDVYKMNVSQRYIQTGGELKCSVDYNSIVDEFKFGSLTAEQIFINSMNSLDKYFGK